MVCFCFYKKALGREGVVWGMINYIWFAMIAIGIVTGIVTGNVKAVTDAALSYAESGFEIALGLTAVMALWLGIMRIAEEAGLVTLLSRALRPVLVRLFPDVPAEHPAMGAMLMNMAANILGLGNAATPFGIKAMNELQQLNNEPDTATDSMCMFLAINTSSVTVVPATIIAYRTAAGSANATEILGAALAATTVSTTVAIIAAKLLSKRKKNRGSKPDFTPEQIEKLGYKR